MVRACRMSALGLAWSFLVTPVTAKADESHCTSIQAKCAMEAGRKCDRQSGHWCYGASREGEHCGGNPAAFRTCMVRHGVSVPRASNVDRPVMPATASNLGKCTTIQGRCVVEAGGY